MENAALKIEELPLWTEPFDTFDEFGLKVGLLRGIYGSGIERPFQAQAKTLLALLKRKDAILHAPPGIGRTTAYLIAVLQLIDSGLHHCQALVMVSSKEIAHRTLKIATYLQEYLEITSCVCVGEINNKEKKKIQESAHIIIGTPNRVYEMIKAGVLKIGHLQIVILDQLDEILNTEFQPQIQEILKLASEDVQIGIVSTGMPLEVSNFIGSYMKYPAYIFARKEEVNLDSVRQYYIGSAKEEWKLEALLDLLENIDIQQCVIYCKKKGTVDKITEKLNEKDFLTSSLYEHMDLCTKEEIMKEWRIGLSRSFITNNLLVRIGETPKVTMTMNYDLPPSKEVYLERIAELEVDAVEKALLLTL